MKNFNRLTISDVRHETTDTVSIAFAVPKNLGDIYNFKAGQHVILRKKIGGEEVRRTYSLCSQPGSGELRVAIRGVAGGSFSGFANEALNVGDSLDVGKPIGGFFYEPAKGKNTYAAFAAGSGITPIISILKTALAREPESNFTLFYGNQDRQRTIFLEELMALKNMYMDRLSLHFFMSKQTVDGDIFNGRMTRVTIDKLLENGLCPSDAKSYFLCGPNEMMDSVIESLDAAGVPETSLKLERFYAGKKAAAPKELTSKIAASQVTIIQDGTAQTLDYMKGDGSLLDAALAAGMDMSFACKGGVCATCRAKVTQGEVEQALNYGLEKEELEQGFVLTCQSIPKTKKLTLNFDE